MRKQAWFVLLVLIVSVILSGCSGSFGNGTLYEGWNVYVPSKSDAAFANPDMGYIYYENAMKRCTPATKEERIALMQEWSEKLGDDVMDVTVMSCWGDIEGTEGVYDWGIYDEAIQFWIGKGKSVHLRFCTDDLMYYGVSGRAPDWLDTKYHVPYIERNYDGVIVRFYDYTNEDYQMALNRFLKELASKYADNPNIKLVDMRGYGLWGEWHSGYNYDTLEQRREGLKAVIDAWTDAFAEKKILLMSVSPETSVIRPSFDPNMSTEDFIRFQGMDYAIANGAISFRRDGVGGVINAQDAELLEEMYRSNRNLPIVLEFAQGYDFYATNEQVTKAKAVEEGVSVHGTYISLLGWDRFGGADKFLLNDRDILEENLKQLGYRFVPKRFFFTDDSAGTISVAHDWANEAQSRAFKNYTLTFGLFEGGTKVWESDGIADFDCRVMTAGNIYSYYTVLQPDVGSGTYELRYRLNTDLEDNRSDWVRLATDDAETDGWYPIGEVNFVASKQAKTTARAGFFEDFEGKSKFTLKNGASVEETDIYGGKKAAVSAGGGEFAQSTQKLRKDTVYTISFDYKMLDAKLNSLGFNEGFTVKIGDRVERIRCAEGNTGRYQFTFISNGNDKIVFSDEGSKVAVDNISVIEQKAITDTFDDTTFQTSNGGAVTDREGRIIEGNSLYLSGSGEESKVMAMSALNLEKGSYQISFDGRALASPTLASSYFMRIVDGNGKVLKEFKWYDLISEDVVTKSFAFRSDTDGCEIQFGITGVGKYVLDNLSVIKFDTEEVK